MTASVRLAISREVVGKANTRSEHKALSHRLRVETMTLEQLRDHLSTDGYSICCAELREDPATGYCTGRTYADFVRSAVVGVDIDNGLVTLDDLRKDPYLQRYAAFAYTTASHTPESPRLRVIFALQQPVDDAARYKQLVQVLSEAYQGDANARDAVRLFYGSPGAEVCYWGQTLPAREVDQLLASYQPTADTKEYQQDVVQRHYSTSRANTRHGLSAALWSRYGNSADSIVRTWDVGSNAEGQTVYWYRNADDVVSGCTVASVDATTGAQHGPSTVVSIAAAMPRAELTHEDLQEMLRYVPAVQEHLDWKRTVAGVFNYYGCDERVLSMLSSWSPSTVPYRRLYSSRLASVGIGTVVWQAQQHGYRLPRTHVTQTANELPLYGAQFVGRTRPDVPVYLVDSERSAVVGSPFVIPYVIAAIGPVALTRTRAHILAGRDVFLVTGQPERQRDAMLETLYSVGARPVADVDGIPLREYLLPGNEASYELADHYLTSQQVATAELPQLDLSLDDLLPELDLSLDDVLGPFTVDLPELELPTVADVLPRLETYNVDTARLEHVDTALRRAFGKERSLLLSKLLERYEEHGIANGPAVNNAALSSKPALLRLRLDFNTYEYVAELKGGTK